jgi:hypothetical protein
MKKSGLAVRLGKNVLSGLFVCTAFRHYQAVPYFGETMQIGKKVKCNKNEVEREAPHANSR